MKSLGTSSTYLAFSVTNRHASIAEQAEVTGSMAAEGDCSALPIADKVTGCPAKYLHQLWLFGSTGVPWHWRKLVTSCHTHVVPGLEAIRTVQDLNGYSKRRIENNTPQLRVRARARNIQSSNLGESRKGGDLLNHGSCASATSRKSETYF